MINNNKIIFIINETYKSIKELDDLSSDIIKKVSVKNVYEYNKKQKFDYIWGIKLSDIDHSKFSEIKNFINDSNISISFMPENTDYPKQGEYLRYKEIDKTKYDPKLSREITVYYDYNSIKEYVDDLIKEKHNNNKNLTSLDLFSKFWYTFHSSLIHELQHAYDDYVSKGMAYKTKKYGNYLKSYSNPQEKIFKDQIQDAKQALRYLNLPHEIWARFTQAVGKVHFYECDMDENGILFDYKMKPLHKVIRDFIFTFDNYRVLSPSSKKRLIRKIAQFWHIEQDKINLLNKEYNQQKLNENKYIDDILDRKNKFGKISDDDKEYLDNEKFEQNECLF